MKKILSIILIGATCVAWAQENEQQALKENNVAKVYKYQYVHAFDKSDDTCLFESWGYNPAMQNVNHRMDYKCLGYQATAGSELSYEQEKIKTVKEFKDDEPWSLTTYHYIDEADKPDLQKVFYYQTNDSSTKKNTYFTNKKGRLDSTFSVEIMQNGLINKTWTFARYNKKDELVQLYITDSSYTPLQAVTYDLDKKGKMMSMSYQTYGDNAQFSQTFYTYNQEGRLATTENHAEQRQVYLYNDKGLLSNTLSYNPEGKLEVEYIYTYDYHN